MATQTHYHTCSFCEALCGLEITVRDGGVAAIRGDQDDPLSRGYLCPKAMALQDLHEDPDRIRAPMRRVGSEWEEIGWDEALDETGERIHEIQRRHGRHAMATYSGNPAAHNYGILLTQVTFQQALRTHNRYSASSVDQIPHMFSALEMFGHQLLLPVPDVDRTRLFVLFGANPAVSNGSLMTAPGISRRIKAIRRRGGRVIVLDPRRTETARLADEHHFVRPGTDALLLLSLIHVIFAGDRVDTGEWRRFTTGLADLERASARFPPDRVSAAVGMSAAAIRSLALEISAAESAAIYGRLGVCTQQFGGLSAWLLYALAMITGNLDQVGGMMFTRPAVDLVQLAARLGQKGHYDRRRSRVSGLPEFGGEFPVAALSEEIETPGEGQIRGLLTIAGNPVLSTPEGSRLGAALAGLDFMVSLDFYLNETTRYADIILPPPGPLERDHFGLAFHALAVRNTAKYHTAVFEPPSGALHDWQILLALTRRLLALRGGVRNRLDRLAAGLMNRFGPASVLDLALRFGPSPGLSLRRLRGLPHGVDLGPWRPGQLPERLFTPDGTVRLAPPRLLADLPRLEATLEGRGPSIDGRLLLIGRRQLRSNNSWLHNSERLMRGKDRCTLLMHPEDASRRGIESGAQVAVRSRVGEVTVAATVTDEIMPGVVSLPHGFGHGRSGVRLSVATRRPGVSSNDLTDTRFRDELTGNAGLSGVPVEVVSAVGPSSAASAPSV